MSDEPRVTPLLRRILAAALGAVAVLAVVLAVIAAPLRSLVTSQESYLAVVGPVIEDSELRDAVADALAQRAVAAVPEGALTQWLPDAVGQRAGVLGRSVLTGLIRDTVTRLLASQQAQDVWRDANVLLHRQASATLRGSDDALVGVRASDGDAVLTLDLTRVWDRARAELADLGLPSVLLPERAIVIDVADGASLVRAQRATSLLLALPFVGAALALLAGAGAVLVAGDRRRAISVLVGGITLGAGLAIGAIALVVPRLSGVMSTPVGDLLVAGLTERAAGLVLSSLWWLLAVSLLGQAVALWFARSRRRAIAVA